LVRWEREVIRFSIQKLAGCATLDDQTWDVFARAEMDSFGQLLDVRFHGWTIALSPAQRDVRKTP